MTVNERFVQQMEDVKIYPPGVVPEPFVYPWLLRKAAQELEQKDNDE